MSSSVVATVHAAVHSTTASRAWPDLAHVTVGQGPVATKPSNLSSESLQRWCNVLGVSAEGPQMGPGLPVLCLRKLSPPWPQGPPRPRYPIDTWPHCTPTGSRSPLVGVLVSVVVSMVLLVALLAGVVAFWKARSRVCSR